MADDLLEKARDIFEGQIVSFPRPKSPQNLTGHVGLRWPAPRRALDHRAAHHRRRKPYPYRNSASSVSDSTQIVAFVVGYSTQDIALALWILLAGAALTFVAVVPPWPFFNKNAVDWLPPQSAGLNGVEVEVT